MIQDIFLKSAVRLDYLNVLSLDTAEKIETYLSWDDDMLLKLGYSPEYADIPPRARQLVADLLASTDDRWYKHVGDFSNPPESDSLKPTDFVICWKVDVDKNTVSNVMPKVLFHRNGRICSGLVEAKVPDAGRGSIYRVFTTKKGKRRRVEGSLEEYVSSESKKES